ncbi:hypothetical protein [Rhizobium straminoryzae]|uniref:DNA pilot protein n=1 Tax=Rhizobium straminoryzae TaxID=1387186 RepID=A0A549TGM9_9HYPH|nr:hypothetical protein [Rhizobium straminoryzae]TRL41907.1 hypothetical protein FNA46_03300 [Rhizobium straminoryzae]
MSIWSAVGAIGSSLLGGIFGSKKQKTESTVDYVKMAQSAEAAGFNPLTALRNGGSAGFTSTVQHPGLSGMADAISQIGGTLGAALDEHFDPIAQKRNQVESALLDYQLEKLQSKGKSGLMFGDVPSKAGSSLVRSPVPPLSSTGKAAPPKAKKNAPGEGTIVGGDDPKASSLGWSGERYGWFHAPFFPDAETFETIYGESEIGSSLYGAGKVIADGLYSGYRNVVSGARDFADYWNRKTKTKPDAEYAREYMNNIRDSVPTLAKSPKTSW